jgi:hypothetical protein
MRNKMIRAKNTHLQQDCHHLLGVARSNRHEVGRLYSEQDASVHVDPRRNKQNHALSNDA